VSIDPLRGLTEAEVAERIADGRTNDVPDAPVRTFGEIVRANVLTRVNAIMSTLLVLVLVAGSPKDALFAGVIISNSVIGIVQELRARRTLNELAVLSAPKARVLRDGVVFEVGVSHVVADDVLALQPGDQIVVDGEVLGGIGLEVDESLLTGEAEPVDKAGGDQVLSGSFVVAGSGHYRATRIGRESFASRLSEEARRFGLAQSELRRGINTILRWLTVIIPPAALLLLVRLLTEEDRWQDALIGTVAAAVAMVPDGLVLLTSLAFIVGVIALAKRQALAKELASVELLARVDTLCLDKTGTITTGEISVAGIEVLDGTAEAVARAALGALGSADPSPNATLAAIVTAYPAPDGWAAGSVVPFSSARKWAAASFESEGAWYLGAPDILLDGSADEVVRRRVADHAGEGRRVLLLARADGSSVDERLPASRTPIALVLLEDTVKPDAPEILAYFVEQGVDLKVISGDHPATVAAVARRAGVPGAEEGFDARVLPEDPEELADLLERTAVFGRVTPHQKRAMVGALQSRGRVVAMTGDGVNDVLALKDSDMGIAMGSGSSSTRAVAQLVLLDDRFATLPKVLAEGRKVINNIERVANLFITKATYAVLITALVGLAGMPYPFLPRQLTLVGTFSIGVPGFFLALAPNTRLVQPGFLDRVLRFSLPAGAAAGLATFVAYVAARAVDGISLEEQRTVATVTLLGIGLVVLVMISAPLAPWKVGLAAMMALGYVVTLAVAPLRDFFELDLPPVSGWVICAAATMVGGLVVALLPRLVPERPTVPRTSRTLSPARPS
jgi:cation-transporting P-type ATPase E